MNITASYIRLDQAIVIKPYEFEDLTMFKVRMTRLAIQNDCDVTIADGNSVIDIIDGLYERLSDIGNKSVIKGGVLRWKSNNNVPPQDILMDCLQNGLISEEVACASETARDKDMAKFMADYVNAQENRSKEQKAEDARMARDALGPNAVNVITGERY